MYLKEILQAYFSYSGSLPEKKLFFLKTQVLDKTQAIFRHLTCTMDRNNHVDTENKNPAS